VSLETGKKLGFTSSLIFVIVPVVAVALLLSLIGVILSAIQLNGAGSIPSGVGALALFGIGSAVTLIALAIASLVGLVLLLIAMNNLASYYKEPGIFKNILYAVIINIVSVVVVFALQFALLTPFSQSISTGGTTTPSNVFSGFFLGFIVVIVISIVMAIISAVLVWRSFNLLGEKSEVDSFKTAGLLYLIGVLLALIFVGALIAWIGFIFAAIGFRRLKPLPPTSMPVTYPPQTPPPIMVQTKRCPYCQTENVVGATYCRFCGKPLA
jgi:uncharacterized membrane protein